MPYRQEASRDVSFVVRVAGDPSSVVPALRATIREIDPRVPLYAVRSMLDYVGDAMAPSRFALALLGGFAVLGLISMAVGLYGVAFPRRSACPKAARPAVDSSSSFVPNLPSIVLHSV